MILARARLPDQHDLIPEHSGCQIVFREFTELDALDSAGVTDTVANAALRRHFIIPVPVFPFVQRRLHHLGESRQQRAIHTSLQLLDHDSPQRPCRTSHAT